MFRHPEFGEKKQAVSVTTAAPGVADERKAPPPASPSVAPHPAASASPVPKDPAKPEPFRPKITLKIATVRMPEREIGTTTRTKAPRRL